MEYRPVWEARRFQTAKKFPASFRTQKVPDSIDKTGNSLVFVSITELVCWLSSHMLLFTVNIFLVLQNCKNCNIQLVLIRLCSFLKSTCIKTSHPYWQNAEFYCSWSGKNYPISCTILLFQTLPQIARNSIKSNYIRSNCL
jgi:hypothetical protein